MPSRKRKRFWNAECTSFPDKTPLQLKKSNVRTSVASTSISNAWLRCGDGFQSTSVLESVRPTDYKSKTKKQLGPLLATAEDAAGSAAESSKEAEDIIWTSSGSDFSDNENKTLIPRLHGKKSLTEKIEKSQSRHDLLLEDRSDEDEPEFIDWEKDSDSTDKFDGSEKDDSSLEISDSDSCTNLNSPPVKEENDELYKAPLRRREEAVTACCWMLQAGCCLPRQPPEPRRAGRGHQRPGCEQFPPPGQQGGWPRCISIYLIREASLTRLAAGTEGSSACRPSRGQVPHPSSQMTGTGCLWEHVFLLQPEAGNSPVELDILCYGTLPC